VRASGTLPPVSRVPCHVCGLTQTVPALQEGDAAHCSRCDAVVVDASGSARRHLGARRAGALALAALVLLVPANLLPILELEYLGRTKASTVWGGCVALWDDGMWVVATVVFLASIVVPFLKLGLIFVLAMLDGTGSAVDLRSRALRFIERIGRWSRLDVFLLAVLVAVVKLDSISSARPGAGLLFFAGVVVLTMLASASFDPAAAWRELGREAARQGRTA
jgi:paraquat-inducible protein A